MYSPCRIPLSRRARVPRVSSSDAGAQRLSCEEPIFTTHHHVSWISLPTFLRSFHCRNDASKQLMIMKPIKRIVENLPKCAGVEVLGSAYGLESLPERYPTFGSLRTLKIRHESWFSSDCFRHTPLLETVTLCDVRLSRPLPPSWKGLRFLELDGCATTASTLLRILESTRQLDTLILACTGRPVIEGEAADVRANITPVRFPLLRALRVDSHNARHRLFYDSDTTRLALRHIQAPRLVAVYLRYADTEDVRALQALTTEFGHPPTIKTLSLDSPKHIGVVNALTELLSGLSSLQSLVIISTTSSINFNPILSALRWSTPNEESLPTSKPSDTRRICEALEHLSLQDLIVDFPSLQSLVESRMGTGKQEATSQRPARLCSITLLDVGVTDRRGAPTISG